MQQQQLQDERQRLLLEQHRRQQEADDFRVARERACQYAAVKLQGQWRRKQARDVLHTKSSRCLLQVRGTSAASLKPHAICIVGAVTRLTRSLAGSLRRSEADMS